MRRSRFSDEQAISYLKGRQAEFSASGLCRRHGNSDAIFYKWRCK
ncbi:MAG: transposase, partial [Lentilitoribacter sp.]